MSVDYGKMIDEISERLKRYAARTGISEIDLWNALPSSPLLQELVLGRSTEAEKE